MANTTVLIRKSGTLGTTPSSLTKGELALNYADGKLWYVNSSGNYQYFYGQNNGPSFATANINNSLITTTVPNDTLSFAPGSGISLSACTSSKTVTISTTGAGFQNNSVIFANSSGYLSNTSNISFYTSNNTLAVTGSVYVSNGVYGFTNTTTGLSVVYQIYNPITNSLDTIFG